MIRRVSFFLAAVALLLSQTRDDLIVPGERIGPVTRTSTERSLLQTLGSSAVRAQIDIGEGMTEPGLIIYKDDPARRLEVVWSDQEPRHPVTIFICRDIVEARCQWHTARGIGFGTTLKDLERRNGKPFELMGWGTDVSGNVTSYQGGKLERELRPFGALALTLVPRLDHGEYVPKLSQSEFDEVEGEKFIPSSNKVMQKLNPYVGAMTLEFPR